MTLCDGGRRELMVVYGGGEEGADVNVVLVMVVVVSDGEGDDRSNEW